MRSSQCITIPLRFKRSCELVFSFADLTGYSLWTKSKNLGFQLPGAKSFANAVKPQASAQDSSVARLRYLVSRYAAFMGDSVLALGLRLAERSVHKPKRFMANPPGRAVRS